ncbi:putative FAD/NAD(P)-binding domain superfamily [Helianthus annuus]|nr:putative FAD/NAD(P)-binding domain superfamily [Helianthus annuus]
MPLEALLLEHCVLKPIKENTQSKMKKIVESTPNLSIREAVVTDLLLGTNDDVKGVRTFFGMNFYSSSVVLITGTFMS